MQRKSRRISRAEAGLVVVDIQERLLPSIHERERVLRNAIRLAKGAGVLNLPILVTEQYPKGIGRTVAELAGAVPEFAPLEKTAFSCCGAKNFISTLASRNVRDVVLCGIEAHVCVCQTALDLLDQGIGVFVAADAISSRTPENRQHGIERMRDAGATIVSAEMILFELLEEAGTDQFKKILELIK
jgi:nicotinamidase-related amidase